MILPCSVQNFKAIGQMKRVLWSEEISRDLSAKMSSGRVSYIAQPVRFESASLPRDGIEIRPITEKWKIPRWWTYGHWRTIFCQHDDPPSNQWRYIQRDDLTMSVIVCAKKLYVFNSLAPERCGSYFTCVFFELILRVDILNNSCEIGLSGCVLPNPSMIRWHCVCNDYI